MTAYHNSNELKESAMSRAIYHRDSDMLRKGTYGEINNDGFHGCSVACDAHDITDNPHNYNPHAITAEYYGFPEWLEHLRDTIFERLDTTAGGNWHVELKQAIPVGFTDEQFNTVKQDFLGYLIEGNIEIVESLDIDESLRTQVIAAIEQVKTQVGVGNSVAMAAMAADAAGVVNASMGAWASGVSWAADAATFNDYANKLIELFNHFSTIYR